MNIRNYEDFYAHVMQCFPEEACGVVCDGLFVPIPNTSGDPERSFSIDPEQTHRYFATADAVVHSHTVSSGPNSGIDPRTPSKEDMLGQQASDLPWFIVYCDGATVSDPICFGDPDNRPPLLEREFVFNAQDCLSLAADYLYTEHGIRLPECPRDWDWFQRSEDLIGSQYGDWGFSEVPISEARRSDMLLFEHPKEGYVNHIAIYLGNNQLMHHQVGRLSTIEDVGRWVKHIKRVIRHKDLS